MHRATRHIAPTKRQANNKREGLSIIIPAAGMGYRMKSCGPKTLTPLYGGITLIEQQLQTLWSCYPNAEIFIVVGFEAEKVRGVLREYPVHFIYNPLHEQTNVLYSIGLATQAVVSNCALLVYGDLIFNENAVRNLHGGISKVVVDAYGCLRENEVGVAYQNKMVTNFAYGLPEKWAQIAYFAEKELELMKRVSVRSDVSQWFGYEGMNQIIECGGSFEVIRPRTMKLVEIDSTKDLEKIPKTH
jgi:choline kinase